MKRITIAIIVVLLLTATTLITTVAAGSPPGVCPTKTATLALAPDPPWCYPKPDWLYCDCLLLGNAFPNASGTVTYDSVGPTFKGVVTVAGLEPSRTYQLKIEGMPNSKYGTSGDNASNLAIGYLGRWWDETAGWNIDDSEVASNMALGHVVIGYLIFNCFDTDANGVATVNFAVNSSYHVCGQPQPGRPAPGELMMSGGSYKGKIVITEEGCPWRTIMNSSPVQFFVGKLKATGTQLLSSTSTLPGVVERTLKVKVENPYCFDAYNVTAALSAWPANVQVVDGSVSLGDIPARGGAWSTDTFIIRVDYKVAGYPWTQRIYLRIEYDDKDGNHYVVNNVIM